jgi:hypothetical protein
MSEFNDNLAGGSHKAGGTYASGDFSPAAQRSAAHVTPDADLPSLDGAVEAERAAFSQDHHDLPVVERIARVLAARRLSINAMGRSSSAGAQVDQVWTSFVEDAVGVLNAMREPDAAMLRAGDGATWTAMVRAALGEPHEGAARTEASAEIYQKPLG